MGNRYWHELCFSGPAECAPLIEAAEAVGFKFEFGSSESDEKFIGLPALLERAEQENARLRPRLFELFLSQASYDLEITLHTKNGERTGTFRGLRDGFVFLGDQAGVPLTDVEELLIATTTAGPE